jgi:hypothetical protein
VGTAPPQKPRSTRALPLSAAWLVHVDMGVDQAGQQGGASQIGQVTIARGQEAMLGDLGDPATFDQHVSGTLPVGEDYTAGPDYHRAR